MNISWDDDIIFFISSVLKKRKEISSQVLVEVFPYLHLFLKKCKNICGPLLECLSLYTFYSPESQIDLIGTNPHFLHALFQMAEMSLHIDTEAKEAS